MRPCSALKSSNLYNLIRSAGLSNLFFGLGAGRKPAADKKVGVTLYLESSVVEFLGGIEGIREYCYAHLKEKSEVIKRKSSK